MQSREHRDKLERMDFTTLIDAESLAGLLASAADTRPVLLDCRFDLAAPAAGRQAYATAHLPGARYVDLNQDLSAPETAQTGRHPLPSPAILAETCAALGIDDSTQVIAYDGANGAFAARAWWLLRWLGHARVAVLDGGFAAWVNRGGALESGRGTAPRAAGITLRVATDAVVTSAVVVKALHDPQRKLLDARAAERFAGSVEPIDPVAGHVPGAVNHPFSGNLQPDGRFLAASELRQHWQQRLAGAAPENTIHMCGSGVTACHNLLALEVAGLSGAKLYAGSWSEWIRDPKHPVRLGPTP